MADQEYDPTEHKAAEVIAELEDATDEEKAAIAARERQGDGRKTVLEAAGVDPSVRTDASGRVLFAHEVAPAPLEN